MTSTGIIIATHGDFGAAMLRAAERILGPQERCAAFSLPEGGGKDELAAQIKAELARLGPCLILVDMLGGTPWNAALAHGLPEDVDVVSGLSLPILLEALVLRGDLNAIATGEALMDKAVESSVSARRLLGAKNA